MHALVLLNQVGSLRILWKRFKSDSSPVVSWVPLDGRQSMTEGVDGTPRGNGGDTHKTPAWLEPLIS